jgi:hypothetical protein
VEGNIFATTSCKNMLCGTLAENKHGHACMTVKI